MVKIKLAFRPEELAEDAQEYQVLEDGSGRNHLNVHNFGDTSLMEQQFDLSGGPIGGMLVAPVALDEDVFHVPFDLDGKYQGQNEEWVEAVDDDGFGDGDDENEDNRRRARKAMELKSQNSQDAGLDFNIDNSALAAVNMTLDSEMMGDGTQRMDEEEENWHAFDPEEDEEDEDGERHVFDASDADANITRETNGTDISNIELVRGDESSRISMVSARI